MKRILEASTFETFNASNTRIMIPISPPTFLLKVPDQQVFLGSVNSLSVSNETHPCIDSHRRPSHSAQIVELVGYALFPVLRWKLGSRDGEVKRATIMCLDDATGERAR